jgi:hypothetical protein
LRDDKVRAGVDLFFQVAHLLWSIDVGLASQSKPMW